MIVVCNTGETESSWNLKKRKKKLNTLKLNKINNYRNNYNHKTSISWHADKLTQINDATGILSKVEQVKKPNLN